jgi:hypothetical protein
LLRRTATSALVSQSEVRNTSEQIVFGQLAAFGEPVGLLSSAPQEKNRGNRPTQAVTPCGVKCIRFAARKYAAPMKCACSDRRREAHEALREAIHPDTFLQAASC